jgi:hypothetical protein
MGTAYTALLATGYAISSREPAADDAAHAVRSVLDLRYAQSHLGAAAVPSRVACGRRRAGCSGAKRRTARICCARTARQASTRPLAAPVCRPDRWPPMTGTFVCCICGRWTLLAGRRPAGPSW